MIKLRVASLQLLAKYPQLPALLIDQIGPSYGIYWMHYSVYFRVYSLVPDEPGGTQLWLPFP